MSVKLNQFQSYFRFYDFKGNGSMPDGRLDQGEIAHASQDLLRYGNGREQEMGTMLATMVQGGKDGRGLLPDLNNDQALDFCEFEQFAAKAGEPCAIDSCDFSNGFPDRFQPDGNPIDMQDLKNQAMQNLRYMPGYQPLGVEQVRGGFGPMMPGQQFPPSPGQFGFGPQGYGNPMQSQGLEQMMGMLLQTMQFLMMRTMG
ncbi:MAG TPA: hypothetical protein V6C52_11445 [Coleofasciculaceae cyanobacterium]